MYKIEHLWTAASEMFYSQKKYLFIKIKKKSKFI